MSFKQIFFIIFSFFFISSFLFSADYSVTFCSPDIVYHNSEYDITIMVQEKLFDPCNYKGIDYPLISFSDPKVKVISSKVYPFFIKSRISIEKDINPKSYDIKIVSMNENGEKKVFSKKNAITVIRKPIIKNIVVNTSNKKVIRGQDADITILGESFEKGDIRVTIVMSGVPSEIVKCKKSDFINFKLKGDVSKNILPGEYSIYIVNADGTNAVSSNKIIIE